MNDDFEWQERLFKLRSVNPSERIQAARELSSNPEPRSSYFLAQALYDKHRLVRRLAAIGLSRMDNAYATVSLVRAIASKNFEVEKEVVEALENTRNAKAVKRIVQLLNNRALRPAALFAVNLIANAFCKRQDANSEAADELMKAELFFNYHTARDFSEKEQNVARAARQSLAKLKRLRERDKRELQAKTTQLRLVTPPQPRNTRVPCKVIDINEYRPPTQTRPPIAK